MKAIRSAGMLEQRHGRGMATNPQIVYFNRLDMYRKPPDSGERQYKFRNRKRRFGAQGCWSSCTGGARQRWPTQIVFFNCLDSHRKPLDFGERLYRSKT
jgi:hypothetical protein